MDAMISLLFLLAVPWIYHWGVRAAIALKQQDMLLFWLVLMALSLRFALSFSGILPLRPW